MDQNGSPAKDKKRLLASCDSGAQWAQWGALAAPFHPFISLTMAVVEVGPWWDHGGTAAGKTIFCSSITSFWIGELLVIA